MKEIKLKLSNDLRSAMKEKNVLAVKAIRSLLVAIDNAGAVFVEAPKVMPIDEMQKAIQIINNPSRPETVQLAEQIQTLGKYL